VLCVILATMASTGCQKEQPARQFLFDTPEWAAAGLPKAAPISIGTETRPAVRLEAGARISVALSRLGKLRFAVAADRPDSTLRLEVSLEESSAPQSRPLVSISPGAVPAWRSVNPDVVLAPAQRVTFAVTGGGHGTEQGSLLLGDPVLEAPDVPRNQKLVIVVLIDAIRADHTSLLGYRLPTTPSLEAFAHDGVTFEQAHAPAPWTRPSVTSLLTSLDPDEHRVVEHWSQLREEVVTWPEIARRHGYQTVVVTTNPQVLPVWGLAQGVGRFLDIDSADWLSNGDARRVFATAEKLLNEERLPLFLYLHVMDPHAPYDPPVAAARELFPSYDPQSPGRLLRVNDPQPVIESALQRYDGEIRHADASLGKFFDLLRSRGLYDRAAIAVVGDHGEEFKDHGGLYHGATLYEEMLHIPLVIKLPHEEFKGRRVVGLASITDVLPTLAAAVGWESAPGMTGRSLRAMMEGRDPGRPTLTAFAQSDTMKAYALIMGNQKLIRQIRPFLQMQLVDLRKDPGEQHPIDRKDTQDDMLAALQARIGRSKVGWHVRVCSGEAPAHVSLTFEGAGTPVGTANLEADDRVDASPDGRRLRFIAAVAPVERPSFRFVKVVKSVVRDSDEIWFPGPRATLRLDASADDGRLQIRLGRAQSPAAGPAITLDPDLWTTPATQGPMCPSAQQPTLLAWYVPAGPQRRGALDAKTRERLRALGYVAD
jgi:arylsulfatase A-like enzyme